MSCVTLLEKAYTLIGKGNRLRGTKSEAEFQFGTSLCWSSEHRRLPSIMLSPSEIIGALTQAATDAGFELAGVAPVEYSPELEYFPRWIADGYAGKMKYLEARDEQGRLKRASLAHAARWARSVIVCAINYNTAHPYSTQVSDNWNTDGFRAMHGAWTITSR